MYFENISKKKRGENLFCAKFQLTFSRFLGLSLWRKNRCFSTFSTGISTTVLSKNRFLWRFRRFPPHFSTRPLWIVWKTRFLFRFVKIVKTLSKRAAFSAEADQKTNKIFGIFTNTFFYPTPTRIPKRVRAALSWRPARWVLRSATYRRDDLPKTHSTPVRQSWPRYRRKRRARGGRGECRACRKSLPPPF